MSDANDEVTVLHLITRFLDGGAETTTEHTLQALLDAPEAYDLRLGTGSEYDCDRLADLSNRSVDPVVFSSIRHYNPLTAVVAVFAVALYLHRAEVDIVHTHSTEAGIIGRIAGWLADTPVVIHEVHGDPITDDRSTVLNAFLGWAERLCAPLATRIIVKSERIRDTYLKRGIGSPDQYELIYHGVETAAFRRAADNEGPSDDGEAEPTRLLFVGRLAEGKGLFDLLDAVEQMDDLDVQLDIVGGGPLEDEVGREVCHRDLEDIVAVHGYRDDIPSVMATADVLVLPSYREGTPRVITEARAAGLPVVATDIAGIPEMIRDGETGYLVAPGDVDSLRGRLEELVKSPELRRRMGSKTREGLEEFERDMAAQAYRDLYRDLSSNVR